MRLSISKQQLTENPNNKNTLFTAARCFSPKQYAKNFVKDAKTYEEFFL